MDLKFLMEYKSWPRWKVLQGELLRNHIADYRSSYSKMGYYELVEVAVDENDNISFRGQQDVRVLVDGRPTNMSASVYLKMLSSESIEKIELITNPSAIHLCIIS